ncbi:MarR family winged helix-turn-helix transcriptional regulator [Pseudoclavibacter terrae]|uniref:MarR family transcriptional regulator n=1 Tax=Pseudoclavibacter terrae TaxID=1530195 RepID=A0A7J5B4S9_9MICO|nr:MarR family transcriptional regulator [Pseudoclavibacter terrae]KAB1639064.1 MarR family transcriptional regulator [Pseudoclavibacter terrae]
MTAPADRVTQILAEWARERPDLDASPMGVIGRIHRIGLHLTDELTRVYREFGLGEGDFDVLATLRRAGAPFERTPSELAASTMVTTGAMTKRVDRLEGAGLVSRRVSEADGRGRVVQLTAPGLEVIDRAYSRHLENEERLLSGVSEDDRAALARILGHWLADVEGTGRDASLD